MPKLKNILFKLQYLNLKQHFYNPLMFLYIIHLKNYQINFMLNNYFSKLSDLRQQSSFWKTLFNYTHNFFNQSYLNSKQSFYTILTCQYSSIFNTSNLWKHFLFFKCYTSKKHLLLKNIFQIYPFSGSRAAFKIHYKK